MKFTLLAIVVLSAIAGHNTRFITAQKLTDRLNYYRANPKKMITYIKSKYLGSKGVNCSTGIHATWRLRFKEKCRAINACIQRLQRQKPCQKVFLDEGLQKISYDHSVYQVRINQMTHTGPAGKRGLGDRIRLYNLFRGRVAENIANSVQGWEPTEDKLIADLLVDDGVYSRGHYNNIFNCELNTWGVGVAPMTYAGRPADRVTTFFATKASCCNKCPMSSSVRRKMGWTGIRSNSCTKKC